MKIAKYLVPFLGIVTICHLIACLYFPVDSATNTLVAPDWYPIVLVSTAAIPAICIWLYESLYFRSSKFASAKESVSRFVGDCNDLNEHIESLKDTTLIANRTNYGTAVYTDNSSWNISRPELAKRINAPNIYNCSKTVCDNASREPFKYVCKYFGVEQNEETLKEFENILNNFEAAEEGKISLLSIRNDIISKISNDIPWFIRTFAQDKLRKNLGFQPVDFKTVYFPKYVFQYVSSGGKVSTKCEVTMNIQNLNAFVVYLSERIKFRNSAAGQRALMTSRLRAQIKKRDGYTCKHCGASVSVEPNLLLEIDHIVPVSKGGLTVENNLQTLCWRCNRTKGAKIQRP